MVQLRQGDAVWSLWLDFIQSNHLLPMTRKKCEWAHLHGKQYMQYMYG